jgi:signal peptidase I
VHAEESWIASASVGSSLASAQFQEPMSSREPPPAGKRIEAQDGDTILIRDGGRVRRVRRSEANVRAIYNAADRWIILLVDHADPTGSPPDGKVDSNYRYDNRKVPCCPRRPWLNLKTGRSRAVRVVRGSI